MTDEIEVPADQPDPPYEDPAAGKDPEATQAADDVKVPAAGNEPTPQ